MSWFPKNTGLTVLVPLSAQCTCLPVQIPVLNSGYGSVLALWLRGRCKCKTHQVYLATVQTLEKVVWQNHHGLHIVQTFDLAAPLLGMCPQEHQGGGCKDSVLVFAGDLCLDSVPCHFRVRCGGTPSFTSQALIY